MNLLIDIGNTRVKYVLENQGVLHGIQYCLIDELIDCLSLLSGLRQIVLVSVSNQSLADKINQWSVEKNIAFKQVVTQASEFSINNAYCDHTQMGADRWVAITGANVLYPKQNILIVDSGTATTFDFINCHNNHLGGWIIPGVDMMMNSLFQNTDKVFGEVGEFSSTDFSDNTNANVNHGCWAATFGAIQVAIKKAKETGYEIDKVVFTGGNGKALQRLMPQRSDYCDNLIFVGLQRQLKQM